MPVNGIFQNGIFACGFDFVNTSGSVLQVFDAVGGGAAQWTTSNTRFSSGVALLLSGSTATKNLNVNQGTLIHSWAFMTQGLPSSGWAILMEWVDNGTVQVSLQVNSLGQLQFFQGSGTSTLLGLPSVQGTVVASQWIYFQTQTVFSPTGGSVYLLTNSSGLPAISASGLNTAPSGNSWVNQIRFISSGFPGGGLNQFFDDWYMLDMTGTAPYGSFLGNIRAVGAGPNADSATAGLNTWSFTTPQGTDYGNFAQNPANATDYNYSATVGARASCKFAALSVTTSRVVFLNTWINAELDAVGPRTIAVVYRNNAVDQVGPTISPVNGTYANFNTISTIDPNTGQPWANGLVSAVTNLEVGPEVIS